MAANGREAIRQMSQRCPAVAILDIAMPELNGIEATRLILADQPSVGVIMLTMLEDDDSVFAAMRGS